MSRKNLKNFKLFSIFQTKSFGARPLHLKIIRSVRLHSCHIIEFENKKQTAMRGENGGRCIYNYVGSSFKKLTIFELYKQHYC